MPKLRVTILVLAGCSFGWFAVLGAGCTPSAAALCERICECGGCSDTQREDCIDDLEDSEKAADEAGCGLEFNDVASCYDDEFECRNDTPRVDGCDAEVAELQRCAAGANVGAFGDSCELANRRITDKLEAQCAVQVEQPEEVECTDELAEQSTCVADCVDLAPCAAFTGEDATATQEFSDCASRCLD